MRTGRRSRRPGALENILAKMGDAQPGRLAFGAVEIDGAGRILRYNAIEGTNTGRDPRTMVGKNFFTEVAPGTNRPEFKGVFMPVCAAGT